MLFLIGLGLGTKDLSALALEEIKEADQLLLETYTSFIPKEYADFIARQAGREPKQIKRKDLEDDIKHTVAMAKDKKVVILVPGDPLIATTHSIILNEAKAQKIKCEVIHAPSVFSIAIGESGLDVYKFGPTVTIPFWSDKYKPRSFIDSINKNLQNGQHTLVLLDIDQKNSRPMRISEAMEIMMNAISEKSAVSAETEILILANLGRHDKEIRQVKLKDMNSLSKVLEGKVLSLIVPGELSFAEKDSLYRVLSNP
ncbi:MAG: diphthine synthase [Candidatus Micrarchaeota archaeon]|nr:diphthine synthase [Candidatus Micrarchaeota archaeon]